MTALREPFSQECSNPGYDDRWTCPACYQDLPTKQEGTFTCDCGHKVSCTLDMHPVCIASLVTETPDAGV
jgi:hypothetical protein